MGMVIAPLVAYTVLVVAAPLLNVTADESIEYVNAPRLFELGSINEKDASDIE